MHVNAGALHLGRQCQLFGKALGQILRVNTVLPETNSQLRSYNTNEVEAQFVVFCILLHSTFPTSTWQFVTAGYVGTSCSIYFRGAKWEMMREVLKDLKQRNSELNCSIKPECGTKQELEELSSRGSICRVALYEGPLPAALPLWLSSSVISLPPVSPVRNWSGVGTGQDGRWEPTSPALSI